MKRAILLLCLSAILLVFSLSPAFAQTTGGAVWNLVRIPTSGDIPVAGETIARTDTPDGWGWATCGVQVRTAGAVQFDPVANECGCGADCGVFYRGSWIKVGSFYDATTKQLNFTADRTGFYGLFLPTAGQPGSPQLPTTGGAEPATGSLWLWLAGLGTAALVGFVARRTPAVQKALTSPRTAR